MPYGGGKKSTHATGKRAVTPLRAVVLRQVTPPGVDTPRYVWQGVSGAWYISKPDSEGGTERVNKATAKALIDAGYLEAGKSADGSGRVAYFLSAKGAAWLERDRRAELMAATAGERTKAREMADALLVANQLDGRAELNGVYPSGGVAGRYEVDYYDTLSAGRFVVTVDVIAGTADLQRQ